VGRRANHYLRRQLVHGARAVALRLATKTDPRSRWLQAVIDRRGFNRGIVAMARRRGWPLRRLLAPSPSEIGSTVC
jgi:transposase